MGEVLLSHRILEPQGQTRTQKSPNSRPKLSLLNHPFRKSGLELPGSCVFPLWDILGGWEGPATRAWTNVGGGGIRGAHPRGAGWVALAGSWSSREQGAQVRDKAPR